MYYGDSFADIATMRLEAKIKRIYAEAYQDIEKKLNDFTKKSALREQLYKSKVERGEMSQEAFDSWKQGQVFAGNRWKDLKKNISEELYHTRKSATDMINGSRKSVFQDNANYALYSIDKRFNFGVSFTIYDSATVTQLIKEDPKLLPDLKYPDPNIDYEWSAKQITSAITQGVLQGESIPQLSKRIGQKLTSSNTKSMVRCARTAMTGAQNSGRIQAMHDAQDKGIKVQKLWISTLDNRTRDSHRELDGQVQDVDKPFNSLLGEIMYPGDPNASPANVWQCRCSLGWNYPKYSNQYDTRAARDVDWEDGGQTEQVPHMTYDQWKKWVKDGKPENQTIKVTQKVAEKEEKQATQNETKKEITREDIEAELRDILMNNYEQHRLRNGLNQSSAEDVGKDYFMPNLDGMNIDIAKVYADVIKELTQKYDSPLISITVMTDEEYKKYPDGIANVKHDYSLDSATMTFNQHKNQSVESVIEMVARNIDKGWMSKIDRSNIEKYVPTHEFAHAIISTNGTTDKKRNFAGMDYSRLQKIQKELTGIFNDYINHENSINTKIKEVSKKYEEQFWSDTPDNSVMKQLQNQVKELKEELEKIKISDYGKTNENEFFAECFVRHELGGEDNEYTERVMSFVDKYFKR